MQELSAALSKVAARVAKHYGGVNRRALDQHASFTAQRTDLAGRKVCCVECCPGVCVLSNARMLRGMLSRCVCMCSVKCPSVCVRMQDNR
jgi:hypothetical protein